MYLLSKYMLVRALFSSKKFLVYVSRPTYSDLYRDSYLTSMQPIHPIIKSINRVINYFYANGNCLVKCLVKRDLLRKYGFTERIVLGVTNSGNELKAHAWLSSDSESKYKYVHLL